MSIIITFLMSMTLGGCATTYIEKGFGGQKEIQIKEALKSNLLIDAYGKSPPYSLRLQIWDETQTISKIHIEKIVVKYLNNEESSREYNLGWEKDLEPYELRREKEDGSYGRVTMMSLSEFIPNIVDLNEDCIIRLTGELIKESGDSIRFETQDSFTYRTEVRHYKFEDIWP